MKGRELRLLALGLGGLGLIVGARVGDAREESVTIDSAANVVPEDDSVVTDGVVPAGERSGDLVDQLAQVVNDRAIRLMNFRELDQSVDVCGAGISEEVAESVSSIPLAEGESGLIDESNLTELFVGEDVAYEDIDANGVDEAIVHAVCTYGANAREHSLQVWEIGDGVANITATVPEPAEDVVGPFPPDIQGFDVGDGELEVTWTQYAEDDPHCCPSGHVKLRYRMIGDEVVSLGEPEYVELT